MALHAAKPDPGDEVVAALSAALCRCGCYPRIVRAMRLAAAVLRGDAESAHLEPASAPRTGNADGAWDLTEPARRDWFGVPGDGPVVMWPG